MSAVPVSVKSSAVSGSVVVTDEVIVVMFLFSSRWTANLVLQKYQREFP
jgi:hypothetical protein